MIDPSFVDITDEELAQGNPFMPAPSNTETEPRVTTHDLLLLQYGELQKAMEQKIKDHEYVVARNQVLTRQINSFEGALKNNEWDFDFDTLADLASYFDIALEKEYDVTITVRWTGTVSAPMDYDMDDIENILDISLDTGYGGAALTVDVYQDEFEIDYNEVG